MQEEGNREGEGEEEGEGSREEGYGTVSQ